MNGIPKSDELSNSGLLPQQIAKRLRDLIARDILAPGERLRERSLADQLEVSRTPFREALKILEADGLVALLPNRGAVVVALTEAEIDQKLDLLGLLEGHAGRLACELGSESQIGEIRALHHEMFAAFERRDRIGYFALNQAIHTAIVALSGNPTLIQFHETLNRQLYRYRFQGSVSDATWTKAIDEHRTIVELLSQRQGEKLDAFLRLHVQSTWNSIRVGSER